MSGVAAAAITGPIIVVNLERMVRLLDHTTAHRGKGVQAYLHISQIRELPHSDLSHSRCVTRLPTMFEVAQYGTQLHNTQVEIRNHN